VGGPTYYVQAGAYAHREFADDLARRLRASAYPVTLVEGPLIRVRIGTPMIQETAQRLAAELRLKGFEVTLIPAR
jgi:cell division septation protein DedD